MDFAFWRLLALLGLSLSLVSAVQGFPQSGNESSQNTAQMQKLPTGVILVKGAWSSASDSATPLPEGGTVVDNAYRNDYFGITYPLPRNWTEKYGGPPPSDSGYYVLAQIQPAGAPSEKGRGTVLIAAQDLFFTLTPASNALQLVNYTREHLGPEYEVERPPTEVRIADRSFARFDYVSPVAGLHWHVLATEIRCHVVQFIFTSRDPDLIERFIHQMDTMKLPAEADLNSESAGDNAPVCIKDYARGENVIERDDPVFAERTFNPVPVRVIIDKEGKVKHIHFLSAFPAQAKSITDALSQWRFKPYFRDGQPVDVETGILFGRGPLPASGAASQLDFQQRVE